jgi:HNH endonuclease
MSAYVGVRLQRQIRAHFVNCCAYCHTSEALTVAIFEFEHIVPRSAGGKTVFENLCLACPTCNRYKANRQNVLDPITKEVVSLFHPHLQVWKEHFVWGENATELTGCTPAGRVTILALKMNRPQLIRVRRMWVKMGEHPPDFE